MIRGAGMPSYRHHDLGNMFVHFEIEFPESTPMMNPEQKDTLKTILGLPASGPGQQNAQRHHKKDPNGMQVDGDDDLELDPLAEPLPKSVMEEEVALETPDPQNTRRAYDTMEDEDDDGVPSGAERVQCASQ